MSEQLLLLPGPAQPQGRKTRAASTKARTPKPKAAPKKKTKRAAPAPRAPKPNTVTDLVCLPKAEIAKYQRAYELATRPKRETRLASGQRAAARKPAKGRAKVACGCDAAPRKRRRAAPARAHREHAPSTPPRKRRKPQPIPLRRKARVIRPHRAARQSCIKCGLNHSVSAHLSHKYGPRVGRKGRR